MVRHVWGAVKDTVVKHIRLVHVYIEKQWNSSAVDWKKMCCVWTAP